MAPTNIPYGDVGLAEGRVEDFESIELYSGDMQRVTTPETVKAGQALTAFTVVGRDADGDLIPAVYDTTTPANAVPPIGIVTAEVAAGTAAQGVGVFRSGMFNPNALVWDASFDTDDKKRLAFEESQPTIFIRAPERINYPAPNP